LIAGRPFAEGHPKVIETALAVLGDIGLWFNTHPGEAAAEMSLRLGLPAAVLQRGFGRTPLGVALV
jgi:sulfonate transport system substrate-binding protein